MNTSVTGSMVGGEVESAAPPVRGWEAALEEVGEHRRRCVRRRPSGERALS